jgi:hypothetical protein
VVQLPDHLIKQKRGPLEKAEEIPSVKDYYDGAANLNQVKVNCHINANPTDCLHNSHCGIY